MELSQLQVLACVGGVVLCIILGFWLRIRSNRLAAAYSAARLREPKPYQSTPTFQNSPSELQNMQPGMEYLLDASYSPGANVKSAITLFRRDQPSQPFPVPEGITRLTFPNWLKEQGWEHLRRATTAEGTENEYRRPIV